MQKQTLSWWLYLFGKTNAFFCFWFNNRIKKKKRIAAGNSEVLQKRSTNQTGKKNISTLFLHCVYFSALVTTYGCFKGMSSCTNPQKSSRVKFLIRDWDIFFVPCLLQINLASLFKAVYIVLIEMRLTLKRKLLYKIKKKSWNHLEADIKTYMYLHIKNSKMCGCLYWNCT